MKKRLLFAAGLWSVVCAAPAVFAQTPEPGVTVHAVVDLAHEFTFYADGRFALQYLAGQRTATNWGTLHDFDFSNTNMLILPGCDERAPYTDADLEAVEAFVADGGALVLLGRTGSLQFNRMAGLFGASLADTTHRPLLARAYVRGFVRSQGAASVLRFKAPGVWQSLAGTAEGHTVLACRAYGRGTVVVGSRSLCGSRPDAADSINTALWRPLLLDLVAGKAADPSRPFRGKGWKQLGHERTESGFTLLYTDYLAPCADRMADIVRRSRPFIEARMGVPPAAGMASRIMLLPTDGGGFSSGEMLALGVWWDGFPRNEFSMIEFITHESVHAWVLPYPEIWNEPLATYVGELVMADMGHPAEARRRIDSCIACARRADPSLERYDLWGRNPRQAGDTLAPALVRDHHWGKTFWIFEELRRERPTLLADYFKAKRRYALPTRITRYDADNTVAVLSIAMGRDLFPWFRSIGFDVARERAEITF